MTWTYGGDPAANNRDEVRFLIQDTDTTDQLLSDEEIAYLLAEHTASNLLCAAEACKTVALKFARSANMVVIGDTSVDNRKRASEYYKLSASLMTKHRRTLTTGGLFVGGQSKAGVEALDADTTAVQPKFNPADTENK